MKKTLALVLAFVMALSCTAALAEEEEITIGILATLTGYPLNGEHMVKGTQLAADEINAAGGVLGKKLVLDVQDVSNTTDVAINATNLLISKDVAALIGPHYSTQGLAIESLINAAEIPMLVGGTSPKFTEEVENPYLFRIRASDTMQAAAAAKYLVEQQGATNIALTKLDILSYMDKIPVCAHYELDGQQTDEFPFPVCLQDAKPVIEYVDGWKCDISKARSWDELPENARNYVEYVERAIGCHIGYVSVGAERDSLIIR